MEITKDFIIIILIGILNSILFRLQGWSTEHWDLMKVTFLCGLIVNLARYRRPDPN